MVDRPGLGEPPPRPPRRDAGASRRKASNFIIAGAQRLGRRPPAGGDGSAARLLLPRDRHARPTCTAAASTREGIIAPISPYVFIGRGPGLRLEPDERGQREQQQFLEQLCNPDGSAAHARIEPLHLQGTNAAPMTLFDAGLLGAGEGEPARELSSTRPFTVPSAARCRSAAGPTRSRKDRSTRGDEPAGELAFSELDSEPGPLARSSSSRRQPVRDDVQHGPTSTTSTSPTSRPGRLPIMAPGTDPSLPTLGHGRVRLARVPRR